MSEFLTVRLSRAANSPIRWLVWSAGQDEIIASGELGSREQLSELTPYAGERSVIVLLDSSDLLLNKAEIPPGSSRQLESMLPYLLEDDVAQDVDDLHFSVLEKSAGVAHVAAVDRAYLAALLDDFSLAGISVRRVMPDVYALPVQAEGISALQMDTQWLFRKADYTAVVIEQQWLPLLLDSDWVKQEGLPVMINSYTPLPELSDAHNAYWQQQAPELVMALLTKGALNSPLNMLTGNFKPQSLLLRYVRVWRKVAVSACVLLLLLLAQSLIHIHQEESQAMAYREESERIFRMLFPGRSKIPTVSYLKRQINDEETRLAGGAAADSVLIWLSELAVSIEPGRSMVFNSLKYDAGRREMRLEVTMSDFQSFETIRSRLAEHFSVEQGPLDRDGDKVTGSYILRSKS